MTHLRIVLTVFTCCMLLSACQSAFKPSVDVRPSETTQSSDLQHGKETSVWLSALSGVNGTLANGAATAYFYEDMATIIGIQLNIAAADEGSHYEAWIENLSSGERIDLGTVENAAGDVRHGVRYDSKKSLSGFTNVSITLERNGSTGHEGKVVAEGILKATKR